MSDIRVPGFKSSDLIAALQTQFSTLSEEDRKAQIKKTNGVFELEVTNAKKETVTWTVDLKASGTVYKGKAQPKADVTIILSDQTLVDLAAGNTNGQKAFMTGKLKTRGNMMLATKLDAVLKGQGKAKAKL